MLAKKFDVYKQVVKKNEPHMAFDVSFPTIPDSYWIARGRSSLNDNNNSDSSVKEEMIPISLIAKQLYNDSNIILAFKCLYYKYIDSQNAPFMINLSYKTRERLMKSLDASYYKQIKGNKIEKSNDNGESRAAIDDQFEFKQGKSVEWLLEKLVVDTDAAAVQLSRLMNDSLYRFKQSVFSAV